MLDTVFSEAADQSVNISYQTAAISILAALLMGFSISLIYVYSDKKTKYSVNFAFSLVILPAIVAVVIMLVGSNIARAFSMAGVFALVRFRSVPGNSKDITSVFFAMSAGLAAGLGYVAFSAMGTFIIGAAYFVVRRFLYGEGTDEKKILKVTLPENMNYQGVFDDLFEQYTDNVRTDRVRTVNLGSLYEITYTVKMKKDVDEKKFIDEIRCRNGNLNIVLSADDTMNESL